MPTQLTNVSRVVQALSILLLFALVGLRRNDFLVGVTSYDFETGVRFMLLLGADPSTVTRNGENALTAAAIHDSQEALPYLVESASDINAKNRWGTTPLRMAEQFERTDIAEYLRLRGAE